MEMHSTARKRPRTMKTLARLLSPNPARNPCQTHANKRPKIGQPPLRLRITLATAISNITAHFYPSPYKKRTRIASDLMKMQDTAFTTEQLGFPVLRYGAARQMLDRQIRYSKNHIITANINFSKKLTDVPSS